MTRGRSKDAPGSLRVEMETLRKRLVEYERNQALGQLALGIVHDVGNVVGALQLRLQILQQDPRCRQAQGKNLEAMDRILDDVGELLQRLQGLGRPPGAVVTELDPGQIVREAVELAASGLRLEARKAGVELRFEVDLEPRLPKVRASADDLRRTLLHLMIHARDGLRLGGVIRVVGRRDGEAVVLGVEAIERKRARSEFSTEVRLVPAPAAQRPASSTAPTVLIEP